MTERILADTATGKQVAPTLTRRGALIALAGGVLGAIAAPALGAADAPEPMKAPLALAPVDATPLLDIDAIERDLGQVAAGDPNITPQMARALMAAAAVLCVREEGRGSHRLLKAMEGAYLHGLDVEPDMALKCLFSTGWIKSAQKGEMTTPVPVSEEDLLWIRLGYADAAFKRASIEVDIRQILRAREALDSLEDRYPHLVEALSQKRALLELNERYIIERMIILGDCASDPKEGAA